MNLSYRRARLLNLERLEERAVPSGTEYRSIDGTGNNVLNPTWGSSGIAFLRLAPAEYGDGVSSLAGADRPSARVISNSIAAQGEDIISDRLISAMVYAWGQFLDHDLDLTNTGGTESLTIPVPKGDPYFDPLGTGTQVLRTSRSVFDPSTGTTTARQQLNAITAWIDGSMIYGSDAATAASLRTFTGGKLKTSAGNLLPVDASGSFLAGDVRVNENPELTSLQTLFVREHNYWAGQLAKQTPGLSDQELYQRARAVVIGELQAITYNQWLSALLGQPLRPYSGYNASVNPGISNEFATAGFRLGHSLLGDDIEFLDNNGRPITDAVSLRDAFFNPALVSQNGIDSILKYLASDPSSELVSKVVDGVRNFLFGAPGQGGLDLASLNIQRGRDHGLADYNAVRLAYGLPHVTTFAQITSNAEAQAKLKELYGNVDNIDLWVGALAENHVAGGSVGPTIRAIVTDQFLRLRDGDCFWYERTFTGQTLQQIRNTKLADILRRNTTLTNLQADVFFFRASAAGVVFADGNRNGRQDRGEAGLANRVVQLIDRASGELIATARTNAAGAYVFDVAAGLRTGEYTIRLLAGNGLTVTASKPVAITRGDELVNNINFALSTPAAKTTMSRGNATVTSAQKRPVNDGPGRDVGDTAVFLAMVDLVAWQERK